MPNIPPLRDIDEFLVYPARFRILSLLRAEHRQMLKDTIMKNLLYYQINYLFLALCLSALVLWIAVVFHVLAGSYLCYAVLVVTCGTACYLFCNDSLKSSELRMKHYFALITACNFILYALLFFLLDFLYSALVVAVCATLAMFFILLHASLRIPNLQNRTQFILEYLSLKRTVLTAFVQSIDINLVLIFLFSFVAVLFIYALCNSNYLLIFFLSAVILCYLFYFKPCVLPSLQNKT